MNKPDRSGSMDRDAAEAIAIQALAFIASDGTLLPRFLSLTGIEARDIRAAAGQPGFLAGVLQFVLAHEPTLLQFSEASGLEPSLVGRACKALPFGNDEHMRSM